MDPFKITRKQAYSSVTPELRNIVYLRILAGWQHASGAWLCIGETPSHPDHYSVHWRATPIYYCGVLEFEDAFEDADKDRAWARALSSAENAWKAGPSANMIANAEKTKSNRRAGASNAGQASAAARAKSEEEIAAAKELAAKFKVHYLPKYDPKVWVFDPSGVPYMPIINFSLKKLPGTCAFIAPEEDGRGGWRVARGWFPQMNDDNARIEENIVRGYGSNPLANDPAIVMLEAMLKTDPAKWLRGDYTAFWDGVHRRVPIGWTEED